MTQCKDAEVDIGKTNLGFFKKTKKEFDLLDYDIGNKTIKKNVSGKYIDMPSAFLWEFINDDNSKKIALEKAILLNYIRVGLDKLIHPDPKKKAKNEIKYIQTTNGKLPCIYNTAKKIQEKIKGIISVPTIKRRMYELEDDNKIITKIEHDITPNGTPYERKLYTLPNYSNIGETDFSRRYAINSYEIESTNAPEIPEYESNLLSFGILADLKDYQDPFYADEKHTLFKSRFGDFFETVKKVGLVNTIVAEVIYNMLHKAEIEEKYDKYNFDIKGYRVWGFTLKFLKEQTKLNLLKLSTIDICESLSILKQNGLIGFMDRDEDMVKSNRFVYIPEIFDEKYHQ